MQVQELGSFIKDRRNELRLTQPYIAELAGISVNTLSKLERGQSNPSLEVLSKVTEVLGIQIRLEIKKVGNQ